MFNPGIRTKVKRSLQKRSRLQKIKTYLASHDVHMLQIGAGFNLLAGWLNTDYIPRYDEVAYLDATEPFPFENDTFDYIFSEHIIEHLEYPQGVHMLSECYRALKPGGRVRIATPNLAFVVGLYQPEKSEIQTRYIDWTIDKFLPQIGIYQDSFVINNFFRCWGHKFIYDYKTLQDTMAKIGFTDMKPCQVGESEDPKLQGLESHGKRIPEDFNRLETFIIEALKPS